MMLKTFLYLNNEKNIFMNTNNIHDFMPLPGERFYTMDAFYAMPAVSYTHLDVYKRQAQGVPGN